MGGKGYVAKYKHIVTPRQATRLLFNGFLLNNHVIKPTSQHGEWYAKVDPKTGVITWLRRKNKKK